MATQLQEIIGGLEDRVTQRTRDLENQTLRLRVAAEIARDAASIRDLSELLERSAELIQSRFGFYHTAVFLLDANRENAILAASPTEMGQQMLASNHRLQVGDMGIVGRVAATGEPLIMLDTDAVRFNNPYLPNTRSEMALPLKAENMVIGVLDVQSDQTQAFNEEDVAIMQIMADQLATAIERTRLLQEVERSFKELESAYGQYTRENWKQISEQVKTANIGYRFDNIRMELVNELSELGRTAFETGQTVNSNGQHADRQAFVAVPVKLRGQTIGVINLKLKENYGEDTISTVELASERLAAALESARLYEEVRLRADREQSIAQVTSAISASTNYEEILQTTVRELGNTLKDTEVIIQITGVTKEVKQDG
jgi:GAF domain-containing protein